MSKLNQVALIFAMEGEASPIIQTFAAIRKSDAVDQALPMKAHVANLKGGSVLIAINGIDRLHNVDSICTQSAAITALKARGSRADFLTIGESRLKR
jgi:hypothetical protein